MGLEGFFTFYWPSTLSVAYKRSVAIDTFYTLSYLLENKIAKAVSFKVQSDW